MSQNNKPTPRQIQDWNINEKLGERSHPDVMEYSLKLPKEMSIVSIQNAYQALLKRHSVLRTYFPIINGEVVRKIGDCHSEMFPIIDLDSYSQDEIMFVRAEAINNLKDLKSPPLIYSALWHKEKELVFVILIHHILCDAWSKKIILKELQALCFQFHSKIPAKLESDIVQLGEYYGKNKELIDKAENDNLMYWEKRLSDKSWQVDFERIYDNCLGQISGALKAKKFTGREKQDYNGFYNDSGGEIYSIRIDEDLYAKIRAFCSETHLSLNGLLIGGLSILGMSISGNENILIRTVYHGRNNHTKNIIGNLLGCLLLYFEVKKDDTFKNAIFRYYDSFSKSLDRIIYNSEELEKLEVSERCFLSFNFVDKEMTGDEPDTIQNGQVESIQNIWCPLHLNVMEYANTILFTCAYHSNFYDSEVVTSLFKKYFELLHCMVTYPENELGHFLNTNVNMYSKVSV